MIRGQIDRLTRWPAERLPLRALMIVVCATSAQLAGAQSSTPVASVFMTSTSSNPRVGEMATVGATPRNATEGTVVGVTCQFKSADEGIVTVTAHGAVKAIGVGKTRVTATCGERTAYLEFTVRPPFVKVTISKYGTGKGSLFADPILGLGYDAGTRVTVTASSLPGSDFKGWSGVPECEGVTEPICTFTADATDVSPAGVSGVALFGAFDLGGPRDTAARKKEGGSGDALLTAGVVASSGYLLYKLVAPKACTSSRYCITSIFGGACSCSGSPDGPCDFSGTPSDVGQSCGTGSPCKKGLSCNNGRCQDRNGSCPF